MKNLKKAFQENNLNLKELPGVVTRICLKRLNPESLLTDIKRVDNSYRLFAKRHPGIIKPDGWKNFIIEVIGKMENGDKVISQLGWKKSKK